MADYGIYLSIGTLASLITATASFTWKFAQAEKANREWTEALIENMRHSMTELDRETLGRFEQLRQETGEQGHALRTKIHEVETWSRDNFVRNEYFEAAMVRLTSSIEKIGDKLEAKIDRAVERLQNGHTP